MGEPRKRQNDTLRLMGLVGYAVAAVVAFVDSTGPTGREWTAVFVAHVVVMVAILILLFPLRAQSRALLSDPDVFVPTGVVWLADALIGWVAPTLPDALTTGAPIDLFGVSFSISVLLVVQLALAVVQIVWTMFLLIDVASGRPADLVQGALLTGWRFWRGALVFSIGGGGLLVLLVIVMPLLGASMLAAVVVAGSLAAAWNVLTLALLPVVLSERGSVLTGIDRGFRLGPAAALQVAGPLLWSMAVFGLVSVASASFGTFGSTTSNTKLHSSFVWLPGLPEESGWYSVWCEALEVAQNPAVVFLLSLVLLVLGLALALRVVDELWRGVGAGAFDVDEDLLTPSDASSS